MAKADREKVTRLKLIEKTISLLDFTIEQVIDQTCDHTLAEPD